MNTLQCARKAYPGVVWSSDGNDDVYHEPDNNGPITFFSLRNPADLQALEDAVLMDERVGVLMYSNKAKEWHIGWIPKGEIYWSYVYAPTKPELLSKAVEVLNT